MFLRNSLSNQNWGHQEEGQNKGWRLWHRPGTCLEEEAWPGKEEACGVPGSCCLPVWAQAQDPELQACSCLISALKNAPKTWDVYVPISVWHPAILWEMWMQWKQILALIKLEAAVVGHLCPEFHLFWYGVFYSPWKSNSKIILQWCHFCSGISHRTHTHITRIPPKQVVHSSKYTVGYIWNTSVYRNTSVGHVHHVMAIALEILQQKEYP